MIRRLASKSALTLFVFILGVISGRFIFSSHLSLNLKVFIAIVNTIFAFACSVTEDYLKSLEEELKETWTKRD